MFCEKCGKETGENAFCPYCGEKEETNCTDYSENAPVITYKDSTEAMNAFKGKTVPLVLVKIFAVISAVAMILGIGTLFCGLGAFCVLGDRFLPLFNFISIFLSLIGFGFIVLSVLLYIPAGIIAKVWTSKFSAWIVENSIDCRKIIKNNEEKYARYFKMAQLENDDPKSKKLYSISRALVIVLTPLGLLLSGIVLFVGNIGMIQLLGYLATLERLFSTEPIIWITLYVLIAIVIYNIIIYAVTLPSIIMKAVLGKRANKNFDKQNYKTR